MPIMSLLSHLELQQFLKANSPAPRGPKPKHNVTITLDRPDLQPPVYVASSMSSIPWEPHEMSFTHNESPNPSDPPQLHFFKEFKDVEEGQYQYKFRLGPGDWWILDDKSQTGQPSCNVHTHSLDSWGAIFSELILQSYRSGRQYEQLACCKARSNTSQT